MIAVSSFNKVFKLSKTVSILNQLLLNNNFSTSKNPLKIQKPTLN